MNYVDDNLKKVNQDKTIGIIICKLKFHCGVEVTFTSQDVIKYCSDDRIIAREYELV